MELWQTHAGLDSVPDHGLDAREEDPEHGMWVDAAELGIHHGQVPFYSMQEEQTNFLFCL